MILNLQKLITLYRIIHRKLSTISMIISQLSQTLLSELSKTRSQELIVNLQQHMKLIRYVNH
jgi:hypothetical protein